MLLEYETKDRIAILKDYGDIPSIYCNPSELNQVFMHLLSNAAQAITGKGTKTIRTYVKDEKIHLLFRTPGSESCRIKNRAFSNRASPGKGLE